MDQVNIRQATAADIFVILRLQQEWFEEDSVYGFVPETAEKLPLLLGPFYLVAEVDQEIVGFINGILHTSDGLTVIPAGKPFIEIDNVYVSLPFRRKGIGGRLVDRLLIEAKQQDISHALLYSATKDIQSILKFYEGHGFQSWFIQMFRSL